METKTASKVKVFLVKSLKPNNGSIKTLTSEANMNKELAKHDQEAQELINQFLNMAENG